MIRNAKIEEVYLGIEDHGCMTFMLTLDYGDGGHQGFGGYNLTGQGYTIIRRILDVVGAQSWNSLNNKIIRVDCGLTGKINAIGNCLIEDWLNPEEYFKTLHD